MSQSGSILRRRVVLPFVGAFTILGAISVAPAAAVPVHLHCLNLDNGQSVAIGSGVTNNAPHDTAFHNLHGNVHVGAPATQGGLTFTADFTAPYTCPPSP